EFNSKPHKRGVLSMARSNDPDSAGSQFFICVADSHFLDWQYTAFAEVVSGMEVADAVVNMKRDGRDNPLERVEMTGAIADYTAECAVVSAEAESARVRFGATRVVLVVLFAGLALSACAIPQVPYRTIY